jgi:hypothetical protein
VLRPRGVFEKAAMWRMHGEKHKISFSEVKMSKRETEDLIPEVFRR